MSYASRHPSTYHLMNMLQVNPALPDNLQTIAKMCLGIAVTMVETQQDGPELTAGLRKLLEAKDCFVRNAGNFNPVHYTDR